MQCFKYQQDFFRMPLMYLTGRVDFSTMKKINFFYLHKFIFYHLKVIVVPQIKAERNCHELYKFTRIFLR